MAGIVGTHLVAQVGLIVKDIEETKKAAAAALIAKKAEQPNTRKVSIPAAYTQFTDIEREAELEALRVYRDKLLDSLDETEHAIDALMKDLNLFYEDRDKYNAQLEILDAVEKKIKGGK